MLVYLFQHRMRATPGGRAWLKAWLKRVYHLPRLVTQAWSRWRLVRGGAEIAPVSFFSDASKIEGRLANLKVGEHSFVGRAGIQLHAPVTIGRCVCINDGVEVLSASHDVRDVAWSTKPAEVSIGDYAWIATRAIILPGVRIGRGAVVGAGAVVSRDVPDHGIVVGNPARLLDRRRVEELNYSPVANLALFEAWLGHGHKTDKKAATDPCPK